MTPGTTSGVGEYDYTPHPEALMMPDLTGKQYERLKAGIRDSGQQHPIKVLKGTRYLLDGRHRLEACQELSRPVLVEYIDIPEEQIPVYTAAEAAKRDRPTATQKALLALDVLPYYEREAAERQRLGVRAGEDKKGRADDRAAALVGGVSPRYITLAKSLKAKHPAIFERVRSGELNLSQGDRVAQGKRLKPPRVKPRLPAQEYEGKVLRMPDGRVAHLRVGVLVQWEDASGWSEVNPEELVQKGGTYQRSVERAHQFQGSP